MQIRQGHILPILRGHNSEGSRFLPIPKGHILSIWRINNSEGTCFLPIWRGPNSDVSVFYQTGVVAIWRGFSYQFRGFLFFAKSEESQFGGLVFLINPGGGGQTLKDPVLSIWKGP